MLTRKFSQRLLLITAPISGFIITIGLAAQPALSEKPNPADLNPVVCLKKQAANWTCVYTDNKEGKPSSPKPYQYYSGQIRNGLPNGQGIVVYTNDDRYEGTVRNGAPHGKGLFLFANNDRYEGDMRDGKPQGNGTFTMASGQRYTGQMIDGHPHGKGVFTFNNNEVYNGEFLLGQANGQGTYIAKGFRCQGRFFSSTLVGKGNCTYAAGSEQRSYSGELRRGRPEGRGTMILRNGQRFSGEFRAGLPFIPTLDKKK